MIAALVIGTASLRVVTALEYGAVALVELQGRRDRKAQECKSLQKAWSK